MALRTSLAPQPHLYMGDMQGRPLDAGKVYFGEPNKDPELYPINVYYDEALTIAAPQPIRTMGGFMNASGQMVEIYAAETEYSVKVLDGYGRQVFYQAAMSRVNTDGSITTRIPIPNAVSRPLSDKNSDIVSVKDFGAKSEAGFDNSSALIDAVTSGKSLDFGGTDDIYEFTNPLVVNVATDVFWQSRGATLKYVGDSAAIAVGLSLKRKLQITIAGRLNIDANRKAFVGFKAFNDVSDVVDYASFNATDLNVTNVYRSSLAFTGGDGIYIVGGWNIVCLLNPVVSGVKMAAAAGVSSVQGVAGINITRTSTAKPLRVSIVNPNIEEVGSEDLDYIMDQDGIKIFTDYKRNLVTPNETDCVILGGTFKNCLGRAVKSQSEFTKVISPHIIRTYGFNQGFGNAEIDFQIGGGMVSNLSFLYQNSRPECIVKINCARETNVKDTVNFGTVDGVQGSITSQTVPFSRLFIIISESINKASVDISRVNIRGDSTATTDNAVLIAGYSSDISINLSKIAVGIVSNVLYSSNEDNTMTLALSYADVRNTRNTDCATVYAKSGNYQRISLSAVSCHGMTGGGNNNRLSYSDAPPPIQVVKGFVAKDNGGQCGIITPINNVLKNGAEINLGKFGYYANRYMGMLHFSKDDKSMIVFGVGGNVITPINTTSAIAVSTTGTAPDTGEFKVWNSAGGLMVRNDSTSAIMITGMIFG